MLGVGGDAPTVPVGGDHGQAVPPGLGDGRAGGRWAEGFGPGHTAAYGVLCQVQSAFGNGILTLTNGSGEVGVLDPRSSGDQAGHQVQAGLPVPAGQLLPAT
ncbi:MAG: hypothetical protein ACLQVK_26175 [Acidimicrobiales bacterium]